MRAKSSAGSAGGRPSASRVSNGRGMLSTKAPIAVAPGQPNRAWVSLSHKCHFIAFHRITAVQNAMRGPGSIACVPNAPLSEAMTISAA